MKWEKNVIEIVPLTCKQRVHYSHCKAACTVYTHPQSIHIYTQMFAYTQAFNQSVEWQATHLHSSNNRVFTSVEFSYTEDKV